MTTTEYLTKKKITPVIRIVGSNKAEAFVTMTIEQFEEYGKHCAEKPLPTDDEIIERANEAYHGDEIVPHFQRVGFTFGAIWMRDLIRKEEQK